MKKLLGILVLGLLLITPSQADDIRDFQIEGMSIGDSLLNYMSKSFIDKDKEALYPNKKYLTTVYEHESSQYEDIQVSFLANDPNYIIADIEAKKYFPDNINECLSQQKRISESIIKIVGETYQKDSKPHRADESGKSINYYNAWWFDDGSTLQVYCTDWSKEMVFSDELKLTAASKEKVDFILYEAYK